MGRRSCVYLALFWFGVVLFLLVPLANQSKSALDPFYTFVKPRIETLLQPPPEHDEEILNIVIKQASKMDKTLKEEKEYIRKETVRTLDLVTLNSLDPKLAKEKMESKETNITNEIRIAVRQIAKKHGVDAILVESMIIAESERYYKAVSKEKARGLMQLMPDTANKLGVKDSFNPVANIDGGVRYIKYLLKIHNGNVKLALASYNAGPGKVERAGNQIPDIKETRDYIDKVLNSYASLKLKGKG